MEPFIIYLGNINGIKSLAYKNTNTPHPIMNNSESILQTIPVWEKLFKYIIRENKTSPIGIIAIYANWKIPNNSAKSSDSINDKTNKIASITATAAIKIASKITSIPAPSNHPLTIFVK